MAKNTKEAVEFLLGLGQASGSAYADHELSLSDAIYFFDSLKLIIPAFDDASLIPTELAAWQESDTVELADLAAKFDIPQDNIEIVVQDAIKLVGPLIEFLAKFRSE